VNNDGYDDVIVGASGNDAGGEDAGKIYIYTTGTVLPRSSVALLVIGYCVLVNELLLLKLYLMRGIGGFVALCLIALFSVVIVILYMTARLQKKKNT